MEVLGAFEEMYRHCVEVGPNVDTDYIMARIEEAARNQKKGNFLERQKRKYLSTDVLDEVDWQTAQEPKATGLVSVGNKQKGHVVVEINQSGRLQVVVYVDDRNRWVLGVMMFMAIFPPFWFLWLLIAVLHFGTKHRCKYEARRLANTLGALRTS
jgi:hypothetical protein